MRITFLLSSLRLSGGVILVVELANRLAEQGHTVALVTPRQSIDAEISQKLQPAVTVIESNARLPAGPNPFRLAWLVGSLVRAAPPSDIIVATHTPTTLPVLLISWLQRRARLWLFMDYPEMFRSRPAERTLLRYAPGWFPTVVAISQPLVDEVRPRTKGQVTLLRPGLGLTASEAAITPEPHPADWRILYIGDDRPRKGLCEFVQAMQQVQTHEPHALAVIVCKNTCKINKEIKYELHIRPDDAALAALYRGCDLFVSTSWGEGLGYPALQAMAFGKPVVVADSGGVRDYAIDGVNALIVPAQNANAVAKAVVTLLEDEALRARLQRQGRQAAALYDWDAAAVALVHTIETLTQAASQ
jgi:glycosyltransferase involved in cell wall biosynthesis